MQHNPIISGSSEGVCPSGNIRRILSKFPDICRRSHFCHDRKVSSIRQWQSFGLCMRKQHFPFFKFMCTSRNYVLEDTAGFSDAGFFLYPVAGSVLTASISAENKNENPHQKKDRLSVFLAEIPRKKTWNFCPFVCHGRSLGAQYENLEN